MAAYERTVTLEKPLGIVLEELGAGGGVKFEAFRPEGSAAAAASELDIAPGDRLLKIGDDNVAKLDFDSIMERLIDAPSPLEITVDDGLATLDITPNLAKSLKPEEAVFADLVVRAAVRETRRIVGASEELQELIGELLRVEILLGAGVRDDGRCLVRFFGIFSTSGGGSTYSCNVAATGTRREGDGRVIIRALSCAKDEGWGRTIDLKREGNDDAEEKDTPSRGGGGRASPPRMMAEGGGGGDADDSKDGAQATPPTDERGGASGEAVDTQVDDASANNKSALRAGADKVGDVFFIIWSVFIQSAGFAFGCGIVLNLCGYGYRFSLFPPSVEVGTLEEMTKGRREARFVNEARQDLEELFPSN